MRTKITADLNRTSEHVDFGVADAKGRAIGAVIYRSARVFAETDSAASCFYSDMTPGLWYRLRVQATRTKPGGVPSSFGASQPDRYFSSEAERDAAAVAYLAAARDRAAKQAAAA